MNSKTEFVTKEKPLELDPVTKPKGICLVPGCNNSFLALLGRPKDISNMMAFPPSAVYQQYEVSLRCFSSLLNDNCTASRDVFDQQQRDDQSSYHEDAITNECNAVCTVVTNSEHLPSLMLPDGSIFNGCIEAVERQKASLISELEFNEVPQLLGDSKEARQGMKCNTHVIILCLGSLSVTFISF